MQEIEINNKIYKPYQISVSIKFFRTSELITTLDGEDHEDAPRKKRQISITFRDLKKDFAKDLIENVLSVTSQQIKYIDPETGEEETRIFRLINEPNLLVKVWKKNLKYYETLSLEFLEKRAEY